VSIASRRARAESAGSSVFSARDAAASEAIDP
jgi:hypothetical protein